MAGDDLFQAITDDAANGADAADDYAADDYAADDDEADDYVADDYVADDDEADDDEADDVNTADVADHDDHDYDDAAGNRSSGGTPTTVLEYVARSLADEPDAVVVETDERGGSVRLSLHVAAEDMGRVIGRRGRTAQAIRAVVGAAGARDGVQTSVDIVDD